MNEEIKVSYDICKLCLKSEIKDNWMWYCREHKKDLEVIWKNKEFKCKLTNPL